MGGGSGLDLKVGREEGVLKLVREVRGKKL